MPGYDGFVVSDSLAGATRTTGVGRAFWWRLADNFFRRALWFALPVVAMTVVGVLQALNTTEVFRSSATMSVSDNPLLPEVAISGADARLWETPADATSRIISERLGTNAFITSVAQRAGLSEALESGALDLEVVRENVWSTADGDSILSIKATWADAETSYALVAATITEYERFLTETVASAASEAQAFWSARLTSLEEERLAAEDELAEYLADLPVLPDGVDPPVDVQLQLERLSDNLAAIETEIRSTDSRLDDAVLQQTQQTTEAGRSFTVIDEPEVPGSPESTLVQQAMLVIAFALMGAVISIAALLVTTALDQSIASVADLHSIPGVAQIVTVPPLRLGSATHRRRRRGRHAVQGAG